MLGWVCGKMSLFVKKQFDMIDYEFVGYTRERKILGSSLGFP